jgi:hypothetical protein
MEPITEKKVITAMDSVKIDQLLEGMKEIIDKHDSYFYGKDPVAILQNMKAELDNKWEYIEHCWES